MEIDFVLVGKRNQKYLRDVKMIPGQLQHRLLVTDLDKKKVKKSVRKESIMRRRVWKLNENNMKRRFEERVGELVNVGTLDIWKCLKESVLKACDEVCGKKKGRRDRGNTWWWNEDVKDAIARKKDERVMHKLDRGKQDQVQEREKSGNESGYKSYEV